MECFYDRITVEEQSNNIEDNLEALISDNGDNHQR